MYQIGPWTGFWLNPRLLWALKSQKSIYNQRSCDLMQEILILIINRLCNAYKCWKLFYMNLSMLKNLLKKLHEICAWKAYFRNTSTKITLYNEQWFSDTFYQCKKFHQIAWCHQSYRTGHLHLSCLFFQFRICTDV